MAAAKSRPPADPADAADANDVAAASSEPGQAAALAPLAAALAAFLAAQPPRAGVLRLCVALSGGRDSVVLLHALSRLLSSSGLPFALSALHVHHGISANADAWAAFCADFCRRCAVPLSVVRVGVAPGSGEGLEAAARRARHAVFAQCAADLLALAHHRDDQAETMLLNLLRGAGLAGAGAMRAVRTQGAGPLLVRPLLELPRSLLEAYASAQQLPWIDDESNDDTHFRRNYLRHEVMPRLIAKFPGAPKSLARSAAHFAEGAQLLDELAALDRAALGTAGGRLALAGFNALSGARARNLLRFVWLASGFRAPDTRWIAEALRQLASADALSEIRVTTVDGELHVYRGELYIVARQADLAEPARRWSGQDELPWAGGRLRFVPTIGAGIARYRLAAGPVEIRARHGGERLRPELKRPRRALRKLLQEAALPPWERARLPLLWLGETLAWVGGIGVDAQFSCAPGEEGVLPVWEPGQPGAAGEGQAASPVDESTVRAR